MIVQLRDPVLPCVGDRVWVRVDGVDRLARVTFIAQVGPLVRVSLSASNFCGEAILVLPESRGCPTPGCAGDPRYAAPGRGHRESCTHPVPEES